VLRFFIAYTCIEEMFMSGKMRRFWVCFVDVVESSSFEISIISCYSALVVLVLYYCQSNLSFSNDLIVCVNYVFNVSLYCLVFIN